MNHDYPVQILGTVYAAYQKRGQVNISGGTVSTAAGEGAVA